MELAIVALAFCLSNIACMLIVANISNRSGKGESVKITNPIEMVRDRKERKELDQEQKRQQEAVKTMLHNIDVYDGTDMGQQDIGY